MDISSKDFVIYAVNEKRKVLLKSIKIDPTKLSMKKMLDDLGKEKKLVVIEAGNQFKWISLYLKGRQDVHLHPVHPNELKWISHSSGKTDKIDAKKMAELGRGSLLPRKVHVVEGEVRKLRELLSARDKLMHKRVDLVNCIRGLLKQEGVKLPEKFFSSNDWKLKLLKLKLEETQLIILNSLMEAAEKMQDCEKKLLEEIYKIEDPRIELLESIPAIGKLTARVLLSGIDDAKRFDNKKLREQRTVFYKQRKKQ
jgi:transposase